MGQKSNQINGIYLERSRKEEGRKGRKWEGEGGTAAGTPAVPSRRPTARPTLISQVPSHLQTLPIQPPSGGAQKMLLGELCFV